MPESFNQANKAYSRSLWLKRMQHRLFKGGAWLLLCLLLSTLNQAQQPGLEAQLESLAAAYREDENAGNRARLLAFCQRNAKSPQAALGFFLLGYRDFQDGKFPEAKETLEQSTRSAILIQDYVGFYLASVAFELKEFKECQNQLRDFSSRFPKSPLFAKARLLFWQSSLELKDGQAVLDSLKTVAGLESNLDALFYQAQAHELLGNPSKALPIYQKLYYQFPLYANAAAVAQSLSTLGGTDLEVTKEWRAGRIEKLLAGRQYRDALKDVQLLFASEPASANQPQYQLWQGLSQFGTAQYYAAIQTLKTLRNAPLETAGQALFTVAECYRKLDNYSQFKLTAEEMETGFAKSHWWEEALFSLGNYNLVRRDLDESVAFYQRIVERFPNGARVKDSHWRIAWYTYRGGNIERALELFIDHLSRFPDSEHRAAALYWAGRAQLRLGKPLDARQVFQTVVQRFPTQYYGQLARAQLTAGSTQARVAYRPDTRLEKVLADLNSSARTPANVDLTPTRSGSLADWPRVKTLAQIQLFELAAQELQYRPAYGSSRTLDFHVAQLLVKAKNFYQSTVVLRRVFPDYLDLPFNALPREIWEMFYAVNYEDIIKREAAKYAIDPFLIMALIRQESAFNPKAVSSANAHGLMQLLPSTARRLARGMQLPRSAAARLHDPEVNIQFGMRYFSDLLKQFDGQTEKVLASYNAGEHRVESWMSEGTYADSAEFVDTIPFSETRNYVKIINRNYFFYKALYGGESRQ
jgi:soluble lytic murein transglycosylase